MFIFPIFIPPIIIIDGSAVGESTVNKGAKEGLGEKDDPVGTLVTTGGPINGV
jgi:hypothetical protein